MSEAAARLAARNWGWGPMVKWAMLGVGVILLSKGCPSPGDPGYL